MAARRLARDACSLARTSCQRNCRRRVGDSRQRSGCSASDTSGSCGGCSGRASRPRRASRRVSDCHRAYGAGARDEAAEALILLLEPALPEDDTWFLVESGPLAVPLLQYARQWTRDHGASTLARQALGAALARLSTVAAGKSESRTTLLSARELEVLAELARASPNKVIARVLQMTENTVKFHLKNIFQKLGIRHRAQAVNAAREQGLIQ